MRPMGSLQTSEGAPIFDAVRHRQVVSLSNVDASRKEILLAWSVVIVSTAFFLMAAPLAKTPMTPVPAFIPAYEAALLISDLITSLLLFGQFAQKRTLSLLAIALGYLFDGLIIIPHALSFPGVFAPAGLLGAGTQTTAWLHMLWHGGFPIFVIAFALLNAWERKTKKQDKADSLPDWAVPGGILLVIALVAGITTLTTAGQNLLPMVIVDNQLTVPLKIINGIVIGLCATALGLLWVYRNRSVLDLWLMVVMTAWLFDILLSSIFNHARYDLGFYAGRVYGLMAANFVLAILLMETGGLYSHLARAKNDLEEQAVKLKGDLQETTDARNKTEQQLQQAQKMEAIGQLTGGIAHDFNNLLGVLIGNLDLLRESIAERKEAVELVDAALDAALRGADLNKRLLAFSRRQTLQPETVDVNLTLNQMAKLLRRSLGERVEICLALAESTWPVLVDPTQLETSIVNLSVNARDAMPQGGVLTIETKNVQFDSHYASEHDELLPGDYVMIAVSDTGSGMDPSVLKRVYEPFFTTKPVGKGTGLGLSMVYGFMKQSGGHTNIYSEPGRGTTVKLYLPRQASSEVQVREALPTSSPTASNRELILIVEDNEDMRRIAIRQFQELGYQINQAENADQAIALIHKGLRPNLLFSDVIMPGKLDGLDLADWMQKNQPEVRILLTSGFTERATLEAHEREGRKIMYPLLGKPYRKDDLAKAVRAALE
jgi:signal transduction histidine kinase/CheY-like chemotaxis protein